MASRIPSDITGFGQYIRVTDTNNLIVDTVTGMTNGQRLGLSAQNMLDWTAKRTAWQSLHQAYINPLTCTSIVKQDVQNFIADFKAFASPLLNIMVANPNAITADEAIYHFVIHRKSPTHPTTPITESCFDSITSQSGGDLHHSCKTVHDGSRASLADGADSVQLMWKAGAPAPTNPADATLTKEVFTKSFFTQHCGAANVGKTYYGYSRWYITTHPELAGPWSQMITAVIA